MSQWVDAYIVEDEEGNYYELFGDSVLAVDYIDAINDGLRANSPKLVIRHTIVDIED
jgi:hypothetical protein